MFSTSGKPWARMRIHGPCMIFDFHETEQLARDAIDKSAKRHGEHVRKYQTVAFFPDNESDCLTCQRGRPCLVHPTEPSDSEARAEPPVPEGEPWDPKGRPLGGVR